MVKKLRLFWSVPLAIAAFAAVLVIPGGAGAHVNATGVPQHGSPLVGAKAGGVSAIRHRGTAARFFASNVTYHGGPLMPKTTIYAIFWNPAGTTMSSTYKNIITKYMQDVAADSGKTTSPYGVLGQYSKAPTFPVAYNVTYGGSYTDTTNAIGMNNTCKSFYPSGAANALAGCVTQTDEENEVKAALTAKGWGKGISKMYFLFTPQQVGTCTDAFDYCSVVNGTSGGGYCGYHDAIGFSSTSTTIIWSNIPFQKMNGTFAGACDAPAGQHPNGDIADFAVKVVSHEHKEAITDPWVSGSASQVGWGGGSGGFEISDKCNFTFGPTLGETTPGDPTTAYNSIIGTGKYFIQDEWDNATSSCKMHGSTPALSVSSLSPSSGPAPTTITINGNGFLDTTSVSLNGSNQPLGTGYNVVSQTKISLKIPAGSLGGTVKVNGKGTTTYKVLPAISNVSPTSGVESQAVTINGTSFDGTTAVKFGSTLATFAVNGAHTQITTNVPVGATTGPISVVTPRGTATSAFGVKPHISTVSVFQGVAGNPVTITGTTLGNVSKVTFGGVANTATITKRGHTATSISFTVPASAVTGPITLTNPGGSASTATFTVLPVLKSFSPTSGVQGSTVAISGTGLTHANSVKFNGVMSPGWTATATKILAQVPTTATKGPLEIKTVEGTPTQLAGLFSPLPSLFGPHAPVQAGGAVTLNGANLVGATVTFGGLTLPTSNVTATQIVTDPLPSNAVTGPMKVTTPTGSASIPIGVRPTVTSLSTSSGVAGDHVTIFGNTLGSVTVKFAGGTSGVPAALFGRHGTTSVTVVVPTGAITGQIAVSNNGGTTSTTTFHVHPKITSFSPTSGLVGTTVKIKGSGLNGMTSVTFGGHTALTVTQVSSTEVDAKVPVGAVDGPIRVTTASEGFFDSLTSFNVI